MSVFFIEGFDGHDPAAAYASENEAHRTLLCLENPDNSGWFSGTGDKAGISSVETRIAGGNSLEFTRGADLGGWTEDNNAIIGWGFVPKQEAVFGFAVKYSDQPDKAIPIAMFKGSTATGEQEQASLWASPDGKLFFAENSYNSVYSDGDPVNYIGPATSPAGIFRFGAWQYIEMGIDYTGATPTVTVHINGVPILENIGDGLLKQIAGFNYVSSAHVISPCTGMFGKPYGVFFDDMYMRSGSAFLGPQHVSKLNLGAATQNDWSGGGVIGSSIQPTPLGGVIAGNYNERNEYALNDVDPGAGTINAIGVSIYGSSSADYNIVEFGIVGETGKKCNLVDTAELFRDATSSIPLSHTDVNGYEVYIHTRSFVV